MNEMRVHLSTVEAVDGGIRSAWLTLPTDGDEIKEMLGIDADTEPYRIIEVQAPFADEIKDDMTIEQLNDFYYTFEGLPDEIQEAYGELINCFPSLRELESQSSTIVFYADCSSVIDVAKRKLEKDPSFTSTSEYVKEYYFDYATYADHLEETARYIRTEHGIFEIPC